MKNPRLTLEVQPKVEIELSTDDLAKVIVNLDSTEQAQLISKIAELATFDVHTQLDAVRGEESLTDDGEKLMWLIGGYSGNPPSSSSPLTDDEILAIATKQGLRVQGQGNPRAAGRLWQGWQSILLNFARALIARGKNTTDEVVTPPSPVDYKIFLPDGDNRKARVWWVGKKGDTVELSIGVDHDEISDTLQDVADERERKDKNWGGPTHDDQHSTQFFAQLIEDYAGWVRVLAGMNKSRKAEDKLIQIAALAVAATESSIRKREVKHD